MLVVEKATCGKLLRTGSSDSSAKRAKMEEFELMEGSFFILGRPL